MLRVVFPHRPLSLVRVSEYRTECLGCVSLTALAVIIHVKILRNSEMVTKSICLLLIMRH